ncbi:hypothetical protein FRC08_005580 [Ceratobasidium sp. 394]|nr:hypothetical protein FRC08_005580 [Ceratobasidium sp. 394]KAG9086994.1 hypothetical protein FS749_003239 [Ceratobasidium sp. UAMH 11750]
MRQPEESYGVPAGLEENSKGRKCISEGSGLDPNEFGFLVETDYQSSEYSGADDLNHFVIDDPEYRLEMAKPLVGALDRKANSGKKGKGSVAGAKRKLSYVAVKCDVPIARVVS